MTEDLTRKLDHIDFIITALIEHEKRLDLLIKKLEKVEKRLRNE